MNAARVGHVLRKERVFGRQLACGILWVVLAAVGLSSSHLAAQTIGDKWLQIPDTSANGIDVLDTSLNPLADDFLCTLTGPITQVRVWASWRNNLVANGASFAVTISSDMPAQGNCPSQPNNVVCGSYFYGPGQYTNFPYATGNEQFLDPQCGFGQFIGTDTVIWEYIFDIPTNSCIQTSNTVYWLSVNPYGYDTNSFQFGWKTCPTNWNDAAAVWNFACPLCVGSAGWNPIYRPPAYVSNLDLAFEIITTPVTNPTNPPVVTNVDKWLQIPDTSTNGLDVWATYPNKMVADDFLCNLTGPITEVRVWGSWRFDQVAPNPCFCLGIWTDVPASTNPPVNPFSHPGTNICNYCYNIGQYTYFIYTNNVYEGFYDPAFPGPSTNGLIGTDTMIWEYIFQFPTNQPCIQTNGNIYWLSLQADCFDTNFFLFGWKTCPTNWNDDAAWARTTTFNQIQLPWGRIRRPGTTNTMDQAFEIITTVTNTTTTTNNGQKWLQIPDTSTNGLDVRITEPKWLADDFRCTATGPITEIRIWTSWLNNLLPPAPPCFSIGIWTDIPATNGLWSRPGTNICQTYFYPGQYTNFLYTNVFFERFWDPNIPGTSGYIGFDSQIWEYIFTWPTNPPCIQTNGNIYWLSVTADCFDQSQYMFGWKSCPTNFNDDAVYGDGPFFGPPPPFWYPLERPGTTNSVDLSFQIITPTNPPTQTNFTGQKWLQIPDTSTNGLDVRATDPKILADDFLCTATGPISEVHVWGSWRNDQLPFNQPPCFCLGIWTDIPAQPPDYSRPNQQICNYCFYPGQYTYFPYTNNVFERFWDPNMPGTNGFIGSDTVIWEYVFYFPTNPPCIQTNGNIYWLSLEADCFDISQFMFGWKSCPTNFNDDAVFGDTPFNGPPPPGWFPLERVGTTNSVDLSFKIITSSNPCPPITISCPAPKTVDCSNVWTFDLPFVFDPCCGTNYTLSLMAVTNGNCPKIVTGYWIVNDCTGYVASCYQTVTVVDTTPPNLVCGPDKTVQCGSSWSFDTPTATDDCCTNVIITQGSTVTNGTPCGLIITRTWTATDCCTNIISCQQKVTIPINDTNPPSITCPSNILILTCSSNMAVTWSITATDTCSSVTVTSSPPSGTLFNRDSTNTVVATAADACGNSNSCSFTVTIRRPSLTIGIIGGTNAVKITWPDGGILQTTTNLLGTWSNLTGVVSPYTNATTVSQRFFRVCCP